MIGKTITEITQPIFTDNIIYREEENSCEEYAFLKIKNTHPQIAKLVVGNTESPDIMFVSIQEIIGHSPKKKPISKRVITRILFSFLIARENSSKQTFLLTRSWDIVNLSF
ncbi:hypothetical protein CK503_05840 [Aliifodinibius salipaludis]|uniref:Uncharacterized protein n=1 Tax=Fodinibius salipaludis TaxID=2032627 RepID=A0A2A2GDJ7_9BACT|nr:hypothetical protein [Aliifodinibius salipaludis]PAU94983.1 hypothetical protein CK503_05840 [Aliifodinibius salipaludis]